MQYSCHALQDDVVGHNDLSRRYVSMPGPILMRISALHLLIPGRCSTDCLLLDPAMSVVNYQQQIQMCMPCFLQVSYDTMWCTDFGLYDDLPYCCILKPVPPSGYVALGCLAFFRVCA